MEFPTFITFDCYGTLVDFDLNTVTIGTLAERASRIEIDAFLQDFETIRFQAVLGDYLPYGDVLRHSLAAAMKEHGLTYRDDDGDAIIQAVPTFGPFPDVPAVLERLRQCCQLVIVSNSDDDLIAGNVRNIGVPFDRVITAEQAGAYKPSPVVFEYTLRELGCDISDIVHVAQGFEYDIMPAHDLGWKRVWINRNGRQGDPAYGPYDELPDLAGLPALLGMR
jgi:2-haloacid dehalogenase